MEKMEKMEKRKRKKSREFFVFYFSTDIFYLFIFSFSFNFFIYFSFTTTSRKKMPGEHNFDDDDDEDMQNVLDDSDIDENDLVPVFPSHTASSATPILSKSEIQPPPLVTVPHPKIVQPDFLITGDGGDDDENEDEGESRVSSAFSIVNRLKLENEEKVAQLATTTPVTSTNAIQQPAPPAEGDRQFVAATGIPSDVVIVIDNRENRTAGERLALEIMNCILHERSHRTDKTDLRMFNIHVALHSDWRRIRVEKGLEKPLADGSVPKSLLCENHKIRTPESKKVIEKSVLECGMNSASFPVGDVMIFNERGEVLIVIEYKSRSDAQTCLWGQRHGDFNLQLDRLWRAFFKDKGVPVEVVDSGNLFGRNNSESKSLITKQRNSVLTWKSCYQEDLFYWFVYQAALEHLDPGRRYTHKTKIDKNVLNQASKISEFTEVQALQAFLISLPGVGPEVVQAFANAGINTLAKLIDGARERMTEGFSKFVTDGNRKIGDKGKAVFRVLGVPDEDDHEWNKKKADLFEVTFINANEANRPVSGVVVASSSSSSSSSSKPKTSSSGKKQATVSMGDEENQIGEVSKRKILTPKSTVAKRKAKGKEKAKDQEIEPRTVVPFEESQAPVNYEESMINNDDYEEEEIRIPTTALHLPQPAPLLLPQQSQDIEESQPARALKRLRRTVTVQEEEEDEDNEPLELYVEPVKKSKKKPLPTAPEPYVITYQNKRSPPLLTTPGSTPPPSLLAQPSTKDLLRKKLADSGPDDIEDVDDDTPKLFKKPQATEQAQTQKKTRIAFLQGLSAKFKNGNS